MHDDKWLPMAACNDLSKREAQVLIKRKFPPRQSGCGKACGGGAQRSRAHLLIYGADALRQAPRD